MELIFAFAYLEIYMHCMHPIDWIRFLRRRHWYNKVQIDGGINPQAVTCFQWALTKWWFQANNEDGTQISCFVCTQLKTLSFSLTRAIILANKLSGIERTCSSALSHQVILPLRSFLHEMRDITARRKWVHRWWRQRGDKCNERRIYWRTSMSEQSWRPYPLQKRRLARPLALPSLVHAFRAVKMSSWYRYCQSLLVPDADNDMSSEDAKPVRILDNTDMDTNVQILPIRYAHVYMHHARIQSTQKK